MGSCSLQQHDRPQQPGLWNCRGVNLTTGSNNIEIGNVGVAAESNTIRLGTVGTQQATYIAGISGKTVAGGVSVIIDTNGHLGTITSSQRYKDNIQPMDQASEAILSLQPVTFRYKKELIPKASRSLASWPSRLQKVDPDLVARDEGKPYTVRYEAVNAMLLNEFLKEIALWRNRTNRDCVYRATKHKNRMRPSHKLKSAIAQQQREIQVLTGPQDASGANPEGEQPTRAQTVPARGVASN